MYLPLYTSSSHTVTPTRFINSPGTAFTSMSTKGTLLLHNDAQVPNSNTLHAPWELLGQQLGELGLEENALAAPRCNECHDGDCGAGVHTGFDAATYMIYLDCCREFVQWLVHRSSVLSSVESSVDRSNPMPTRTSSGALLPNALADARIVCGLVRCVLWTKGRPGLFDATTCSKQRGVPLQATCRPPVNNVMATIVWSLNVWYACIEIGKHHQARPTSRPLARCQPAVHDRQQRQRTPPLLPARIRLLSFQRQCQLQRRRLQLRRTLLPPQRRCCLETGRTQRAPVVLPRRRCPRRTQHHGCPLCWAQVVPSRGAQQGNSESHTEQGRVVGTRTGGCQEL